MVMISSQRPQTVRSYKTRRRSADESLIVIESATEFIGIFDWWLSPELYMKRPPAENEDWRLDKLLLRKAQQGVKVCIVRHFVSSEK